MTKKDRNFLIFASLGALSLSILAIASNEGQGFLATDTPTYQCADIVFGTAEYTSTSGVVVGDFTTSSNLTVNSLSASTNCYAVSGSAARIGKSGGAGTLTFALDTTYRITEAWVYCYEYTTDSTAGGKLETSKVATLTLSTSANTSTSAQTVSLLAAPTITSANPSDLSASGILHWSGLDSGGASSNSITVASDANARVDLCKIVLKIVTGSVPSSKNLSGLTLSGSPATTSYTSGESFDPTGLTITAAYSDGSTENVVSSVVWSPSTLSEGNTTVTGSYTYSGVTKTVEVSGLTVSAGTGKTLLSISSSGSLTTTSYTSGQSFNPAGLTITANYEGGSTADVTSQVTWVPSTLSVGVTSVTGSYTEGGVTKTVNISGITVTASSGSGKTLMVRFKEILAGQYCDSIMIKYGDWECLIDGGNSQDEATVASALTTYCTDHVLDFYIGTHSHNDHLGIFTSATTSNNVFVDGGITSIGHIVDSGSARSAAFYQCYLAVRDGLVSDGKATYIPVHAFFNSDSGYTSWYGQNVFTIDANTSLTFLNSGEYLQPGATTDSNPNDTSVCCLLSYYNQRYVFCGDGTGATQTGVMSHYGTQNESKTAYSNDLWSESNDVYVKANHHCSNTDGSNSDDWIKWCMPDHVLISAAIPAANTSTSGVTTATGVHPNVDSVQRFENYTWDIHWNGINGSFNYSSTDGSNPVIAGTAKTIPYYYNGSAVTGEETTTFPMSKYCLSTAYSACARSAATGKGLRKFAKSYHNYDIGFLNNSYFDTPIYEVPKETKPAINEHGELYDSMTDSYC
jgi:hypothetical protein